MTGFRIGHGYDVHRFGAGRDLILGGVKIPYKHGLEAHSDGDVLIHALIDALLGAAALGDIGKHFPPSDMQYKNADSRQLLGRVVELLGEEGYSVGNIDITVVAEAPKLSPYIDAMCINLSQDLNVESDQVNIKATTTEGLGFVGKKEGVATYAVVLIAGS